MWSDYKWQDYVTEKPGALLTKTPSVTVNPAFLQEVKEEDQYFRDLSDELYDLCRADLDGNWDVEFFHQLLVALRGQLALRFSLEENVGYFSNPCEADPCICYTAAKLRAQHIDLFDEISQITDAAADLIYPWLETASPAELVERFLEFQLRYWEHEKREYELIWQAHQLDLGGEG